MSLMMRVQVMIQAKASPPSQARLLLHLRHLLPEQPQIIDKTRL